jgi:hypothetical protein
MRIFLVMMLMVVGCKDNDTHVGKPCTAAGECYPGVDAGALSGPVTCLTKYPGGYCTHTCTTDADCCKIAGECKTNFKEVCASFENQPVMYCFLSCDSADIAASGSSTTNADTFCQENVASGTTCRATGGGNPRKFCG